MDNGASAASNKNESSETAIPDESNWNYYYVRINGTTFWKCNNCDKFIDRGSKSRTNDCDKHLQKFHPELSQQRQAALFRKQQRKSFPEALLKSAEDSSKKTKKHSTKVVELQPWLSIFANKGHTGCQGIAISTPESSSKRPKLESAFADWSKDGNKRLQLDEAIVEWICSDGLSFSLIDEDGFRRFANSVQPLYLLESSIYYKENILAKIFTKMVSRVKRDISMLDSLTIASNIWSRMDCSSALLVLTAHFISDELKPTFVSIGAIPFSFKNLVGSTIADFISDCCEKMQIPRHKIHAILRDSSSVLAGCAFLDIPILDCFMQKIDNCVKTGLQRISFDESGLLEKIKKIIKTVKKVEQQPVSGSSASVSLLKSLDISFKILQSTEIHWLSLFDIMDQFVKNREAINLFLESSEAICINPQKVIPKISSFEWETLRRIRGVLALVGEAVRSMQSHFSSVATVIPFYTQIRKKIESLQDPDTIPMRTAMLNKLDEQMSGWQINRHLLVATFLDPRFKMKLFEAFRDAVKNNVIEELYSMLCSNYPGNNPANEVKPSCTNLAPINFLSDLFEEEDQVTDSSPSSEYAQVIVKNDTSNEDYIQACLQLDEYMRTPTIKVGSNPFEWWAQNRSKFSHLFLLMKKYHSAPIGAVESSRLFSSAENIVNDIRLSFSHDSLESYLFLHHNLNLCNFSYN